MKTIILFFALSFLSIAGSFAEISDQRKFSPTQIPRVITKPNYAYVFQLSTPQHYIDGCFIWITITVAYVFNDDGIYLGPSVSSPTLNHNCGYDGPFETRALSLDYNVGRGEQITSISFAPTGHIATDRFLQMEETRIAIKTLINDNIPNP